MTQLQVMADLRDGREVLRAQLLERQRGDSDRRVYESQLEGVERAGRSLHGSLAVAEAKARGLEAELDRAKRAAAEQVRKAKVKAAQSAAKLKQSEQRARAQEAEMDKVLARLEAMVSFLICLPALVVCGTTGGALGFDSSWSRPSYLVA